MCEISRRTVYPMGRILVIFFRERTTMSVRYARRLLALSAAAVLLIASLAHAQATQTGTKPFEPTVGQAGKDVVWVPTPQTLVERMLDLAKVTPQDFLMDLGSGDGRTVITAAKRGARAQGVEYRSEEHTSELQSLRHLVCRLLL